MKKLLFLLAIMLILFHFCDDGLKYEQWKDTVEAFGDGNYQVIHQTWDNEAVEMLANCKHNQCVMTKIYSFTEKGNYVYFVGHYYTQRVFCKLNIQNNLLSYYAEENGDEFVMVEIEVLLEDRQIELLSSYNDFSEKDREEFEYLINS